MKADISTEGFQLSIGLARSISAHREADVVVLAGSVHDVADWTHGMARRNLPLPGGTIIETLLDHCFGALTGRCVLCSNETESTDGMIELVEIAGRFAPVRTAVDPVPRGTAGCLHACEPHLQSQTTLLLGGSVWFEDDPVALVDRHRASGNAMTVFCTREPSMPRVSQGELLKPVGVYCCEGEVFEFIRPHGFQDIKEQLVPALRQAGLRVGALVLEHPAFEVCDWSGYSNVLARALTCGRGLDSQARCLATGIWCGDHVSLAPSARIVGPVFLGENCVIEDRAVVLGPTILGDDSRVGSGSWVIRTVCPGALDVQPGASLMDEFIPHRLRN